MQEHSDAHESDEGSLPDGVRADPFLDDGDGDTTRAHNGAGGHQLFGEGIEWHS